MAKKLAGQSKGTATWATNVGNEDGQVLMSVLKCQEGYMGLKPMVDGITARYSSAKVRPPEVLYVDRDCCGDSSTRKLFSAWPDLQVHMYVLTSGISCVVSRLDVLLMPISCMVSL